MHATLKVWQNILSRFVLHDKKRNNNLPRTAPVQFSAKIRPKSHCMPDRKSACHKTYVTIHYMTRHIRIASYLPSHKHTVAFSKISVVESICVERFRKQRKLRELFPVIQIHLFISFPLPR